MHIEHTTLRTTRLEETRDFMAKVFDLAPEPRPAGGGIQREGGRVMLARPKNYLEIKKNNLIFMPSYVRTYQHRCLCD